MVQFSNKRRFDKLALRRWGLLTLLLFVISGFIMLSGDEETAPPTTVEVANENRLVCDAERVFNRPNGLCFVAGNSFFRNAVTQSSEKARSGKFSSKLHKGRQYGMAFDVPDARGGEAYIASVWRYSPEGFGKLVAQPKWTRIMRAHQPKEADASGWEKLVIHVLVPDSIEKSSMKFYAWYPEQVKDKVVYFDDFVIEKIASGTETKKKLEKTLSKELDHQLQLSKVPISQISMKAYLEKQEESQIKLKVKSFYMDTMWVLGVSKNRKEVQFKPTSPITLKPDEGESPPAYQEITIPGGHGAKYILFKVPELNEIYAEEIFQWSYPTGTTPRQSLFKGLKIESNDLYSVEENQINFNTGELASEKDILIPAGYKVNFPPGCTLRISQKAKFLSYSPLNMQGTEQSPILIESPDSSANGFTIIQAVDTSYMQHVTVRGFNTLDYQNWFLTGAVTFYESPILMTRCTVSTNHCEDALNTIRTYFEVKECQIEHALRDGFDSDFCTGLIQKCAFLHIGNDGMDFSGSTITIDDCIVDQAGDKGISVGEQATVTILSASVSNAVMGAASKDLSELTIEQISLSNCNVGFAAYQKKPEYGPAKIFVKDYQQADLGRIHRIEEGSFLQLQEVEIRGEKGS